jgi:hypothetical protein
MGQYEPKSTHPHAGIPSKSINQIQTQDAKQNPELTTPPCDPAIQNKDTISKRQRCIPTTLKGRKQIHPSGSRNTPILHKSSQHDYPRGTQFDCNRISETNTRDDKTSKTTVRLLCHTRGCNNHIQREENDLGNSQQRRVLQ